MSRLPARTIWHRLLRVGTLLAGLAVCAGVLAAPGRRLPWHDVLFLSLAAAVIRLRVVVMRRDSEGEPTLFHFPGTALIVIALLRDGQLVYLLQRSAIETSTAPAIAGELARAFDAYCSTAAAR